MIIEEITGNNITQLTELTIELWGDCEFEHEYVNYRRILKSENETCFLIKKNEDYFGFISLSIRYEYVEGATTSPVGYIEGIYIKPNYRQNGAGRKLVATGIHWAKGKGCRQIASDAEIENKISIEFHRKTGFSETNRIINFIQDLPE